MKIIIIACLWCCISLFAGYAAQDTPLNITPAPQEMTVKSGTFALTPQTSLVVGRTQRADLQKGGPPTFRPKSIEPPATTWLSKTAATTTASRCQIDRSLKLGDEGYRLSVTPKRVQVKARTPQGLFYGMQSVMQLLPPQIESEQPVDGIDWTMPCVEIGDEPAYGYRGMMLDVCAPLPRRGIRQETARHHGHVQDELFPLAPHRRPPLDHRSKEIPPPHRVRFGTPQCRRLHTPGILYARAD